MNPRPTFSRVDADGHIILPTSVVEKLGVKAGDTLRYLETSQGVVIEKVIALDYDPFADFSEWATAADDRAYANL